MGRRALFGVFAFTLAFGATSSSSLDDVSVDTVSRLFTFIEFWRTLRARAAAVCFLAVSFFGVVVFGGGDFTVVATAATAATAGAGFLRGRPRGAFFPTSIDFERLRLDLAVFVLEKPSSSLVSLFCVFPATVRRLRRTAACFLFKHRSIFSSVSIQKQKNKIRRRNYSIVMPTVVKQFILTSDVSGIKPIILV